jgi:hypothetical protein
VLSVPCVTLIVVRLRVGWPPGGGRAADGQGMRS